MSNFMSKDGKKVPPPCFSNDYLSCKTYKCHLANQIYFTKNTEYLCGYKVTVLHLNSTTCTVIGKTPRTEYIEKTINLHNKSICALVKAVLVIYCSDRNLSF